MIDNLIWHFPKSGRTTLTSSDNNNIDTFADDRIGNLVREIIQNSLDASNEDRPIRVEFKKFITKTTVFPGLESFKEYLENWKKTQIDLDEDDKDLIFVNRALEELNKEEMIWLRISDFNTTGLWGSKSSSSKTPYFSFVHGAGKNSKQSETAGGSKGVGKNAIFANSNLQTLFVSTLTNHNEKAFIGVSFLVSSDENNINKDWTQGVGFCVLNNKEKELNKPVEKLFNLDSSFLRESCGCGTDIFIPSFMLEDDWINQITGQVIYSFLPAILKNKLSVSVVGRTENLELDTKVEINASNISYIVNQGGTYKNKSQKETCLNIYNSLTSSNRKKYVYDEKDGYKMTMYLLEDEYNGDNKLYIYRCPPKMFIKYHEINAFVKCTGVLLIEGESLSQKLRSIEDATHSKWSRSKVNKTKYTKEEIDEALSTVNSFIESKADSFGNNEGLKEADFDYLVENDWCSAEDNHEITKESKEIGLPISRASFSIRNDPSKHAKRKNPLKRKSNKITNDSTDATGLVEVEGIPGEKEDALVGGGSNYGDGEDYHEGNKESTIDELPGGKLLYARKSVETANVRMPSVNPKKGLFKLIFTPKSSGNDVEIEISILGTGYNDVIPTKIIRAKAGLIPFKVKKNKFFMKKIERGVTYHVNLELDVNQNYIWEVNINANE